MCLNLSQNYQLDMHIYFTYLLFRSKEIIYLCQEKELKYQHTRGKKIHTPLLQDSGMELHRVGSQSLVRNSVAPLCSGLV